jgi:hypothetical protein
MIRWRMMKDDDDRIFPFTAAAAPIIQRSEYNKKRILGQESEGGFPRRLFPLLEYRP